MSACGEVEGVQAYGTMHGHTVCGKADGAWAPGWQRHTSEARVLRTHMRIPRPPPPNAALQMTG